MNRRTVVKLFLAIGLFYLIIYIFKTKTTSNIIRELQQSGRNLAEFDNEDFPLEVDALDGKILKDPSAGSASTTAKVLTELPVTNATDNNVKLKSVQYSVPYNVSIVTKCIYRQLNPRTEQRGDYWVLYNYVIAEKRHRCHESITYTTHADFSFLNNIIPLVKRWMGPISVALHAPGTDFKNTIESIAYLRECTTPLIKEFVTFHIYFSTKHVPKEVPNSDKLFLEPFNCTLPAPYENVTSDSMYKAQKKLLYPVNVGRNIARASAQTHYVLASDIELYPSPSIIPQFLEMIANNEGPLLSQNPKVFPLTLFEVSANQPIPENKTQLKEMLVNGTALPFHKKLCPSCHNVPKAKEWQNANETQGLHIFHVGKRNGPFIHWEPIYIGTHADPLYDERLSWEGKSDKMTQGYALCVLNYDFLILDNAFLVHKPGIKIYRKDPRRDSLTAKTNQLIRKIIYPELKVIYGVRKGCAV